MRLLADIKGRGSMTMLLGLALLAAVALPDVASAASASSHSQRHLEKLLSKKLEDQGLEATHVSRCRSRADGDVLVCNWRATGLAGGLQYECSGEARFIVARNRWRLDRCDEPMVPLLPEVGAHPLFGYNEDWSTKDPHAYDLLAGSGANVARQQLSWYHIQPLPQYTFWGTWDRLYNEFLGRGIRVLWVIYAAPCWTHSNPPCYPPNRAPDPEYYDELASIAAQAARRYPEAIGIEVWNEPNSNYYWGADPDPAAFGEMVGQVAAAVHEANPDMPVIAGGLGPHSTDDENGMAYDNFLRQAYQTGGLQLADAIGAHPYPQRRYRRDYLGSIRAQLFRYQQVMNEFGDANKPIWVTETGVSTAGNGAYTYNQQAKALTKIYTQFRRIANVPLVVYHRLLDDPTAEQEQEHGYGVLEGGNPKPAYCAVAAARDRPC